MRISTAKNTTTPAISHQLIREGIFERGLDLVPEYGGGERPGHHAEHGAERVVPELDANGAGGDALHRERRRRNDPHGETREETAPAQHLGHLVHPVADDVAHGALGRSARPR